MRPLDKSIIFLFLLISCGGLSGCMTNQYGFTNEVDGAYIIIKDVITVKKPPKNCESLSAKQKQECIHGAKELSEAIEARKQKN